MPLNGAHRPVAPLRSGGMPDAIAIGESARADRRAGEVFTLAVTISGAEHLGPVWGHTRGQYWFSYKLFGLVIQTDVFTSLRDAQFQGIRDTFRVRADRSELLAALRQQLTAVPVYLCAPGIALGVAQIPFGSLGAHSDVLHGGSVRSQFSCAIDPLAPQTVVDKQAQLGAWDPPPTVTVQVELQTVTAAKESRDNESIHESGQAQGDASYGGVDSEGGEPTARTEPTRSRSSSRSREASIPKPPVFKNPFLSASVHHVRFSLEIKSVAELKKPSIVYTTFTYPLLGQMTAVRSRPPVPVTNRSETNIPHGYTGFNLAAVAADITALLYTAPLFINVCHSDTYVTISVEFKPFA